MMSRGLQVYGGFVGTKSTLEARAGLYEETVFDGDYEPDGAFSDLDSKSVVYVYPDTVVDGFQIRGSNAMLSNSWGDGGGVWVGGMSAITLRNLHVIGNKGNMGGGLYSISTNALRLKDVVFEDNVALGGGGGMYVDGGNGIELEDCLFENNTAYGEYPEEDEGYFFPGGLVWTCRARRMSA